MDNVRVYLLTGLQHFSGPFPPALSTNPTLLGRFPQNPLPVTSFWRTLFVNLEDWVKNDAAPPPSRYPRLEDGTLVARDKLAFPAIPGVTPPERAHEAFRLDFGPEWVRGIITREPPIVGKPFPALVPRVDEDGNDLAGVRLPELTVPLTTYTGWNPRDPKTGMPGERVSFLGSCLPFAKTRRDREQSGDPRLSLEERYRSREQYLELFEAAAAKLANDRFLLREDSAALLRRAGQEWDEANK